MPAVSTQFVQAAGGADPSTSMLDAGCTSAALANGVDYLVIGFANHSMDQSMGFVPAQWTECEARLGSTRLAFSSWQSPFGNFAPNHASGGQLHVAAVVTGDGSSTLNMRVRSGEGTANVVYGGLQWIVADLSELTVNVDYFVADSGSGDASEVAGTDDDSCGMRLRLITDPLGTPSAATLGPGEEYFLTLTGNNGGDSTPALLAPSAFLLDVRTLTGGTTYRIQWEFLDEAAWEQGDAAGQLTFTPGATEDFAIIATAEAFVSGGVVQYRRSRIIVMRLDVFTAYVAITNGGNIQASAAVVEGANALTYDFGSTPALVLVSTTAQGANNWGRALLRHDGTPDVDYPGGIGTSRNPIVPGIGGASDFDGLGFGVVDSSSGSQTWRLVSSADSPGGLFDVGRDRASTGASRTVMLAIALETAVSGFSGTVAITAPAPTLAATGAQTQAGTAAITAPVAVLAASGAHAQVGTAAVTLLTAILEAAGTLGLTGSVGLTAPVSVLSASGTVTGASIDGTASMTLPSPLIRAYDELPIATPPGEPVDFRRITAAVRAPLGIVRSE